MVTPSFWLAFHAAILVMLALDLGLAGRRAGPLPLRLAAAWSVAWVGLGVGFGALVHIRFGSEAGTEYFAAYLLEKSLSVDNLFVFTLIFASLGIAKAHRHRILLWGVLGALVLRGLVISAGAALITRFSWVLYVFGVFLLTTGARMWVRPAEWKPAGPAMRYLSRIMAVEREDASARFLVRREGRFLPVAGTPLLLALLLVEIADLAFALDSIPAVFAVTRDPFIVYTSNVMAVLGLRALFFVIADGLDRLHYLRHGLAAILVFIGAKMLVSSRWHVPVGVSLAAIAAILGIAVAVSLHVAKRHPAPSRRGPAEAGAAHVP